MPDTAKLALADLSGLFTSVYTRQLHLTSHVCSSCCQHWPSLSSLSSTWRSDGAQNGTENDNVRITQFCSLRTTCLE